MGKHRHVISIKRGDVHYSEVSGQILMIPVTAGLPISYFWIFCKTSKRDRLASSRVFLLVFFVTVSSVELKTDY